MRHLKVRHFSVAATLLTLGYLLSTWTQPLGAFQADEPSRPEELSSQVDGSAIIAKQKIDYKVTTGRLPVLDKTGKAKSHMFFIAYTRKMEGKPASRPLTFCFNGGPGASSSFVHLAAFGPRCLAIDEDGKSIPTPTKLVDNDHSLLDVTDLVFIDPVSTGYSRAEKDEEAKLFHGLEEDTQSVGEFIRSYLARYERSESPTFLAGESYGTMRAAALSNYLQGRGGVKLVGIMLISTVLDFSTISFGAGNDLPNILFLPTYTAAALHHKKLEGDWNKLLEEAEKFANGPYAEALKKGKDLTDDERRSIAKSLSKYTSLSEEFVLKANLRINASAFRSELLRESKEVVGRYDSRIKAMATGGGRGGLSDPSNALMSGPLAECMKNYLAEDLNLKTGLKYNMMSRVNPWNFGMPRGKATVVPQLRLAMEKDSSLRVFVACGYCDLATPFCAAKYTVAHLGPQALQDRVRVSYYEGGHMMYTVKQSHQKLKEDMAKFITGSEP
jgi:carboxypeptidase C (cathepsin A)